MKLSELKTRLVWRWLGVIPVEQLESYTKDRRTREALNTFYEEMTNSMLDIYFKENK